MNYAIPKQAVISLAWQRGEIWEGKWKPQYLQRVRKITSDKGQAYQDQERMRPEKRNRQPGRIQAAQTPLGLLGKGAVNSCTSSGSRGTCVMNTQQKGAGRGGEIQPLPGAQKSLEPGGVVGRLSRFQTFYKDTLHEHRAAWGWYDPSRDCWNKEGSQ